jgi:hypothetical protein
MFKQADVDKTGKVNFESVCRVAIKREFSTSDLTQELSPAQRDIKKKYDTPNVNVSIDIQR